MAEVKWPYPSWDEEAHLACMDPAMLRARIDQLLDERALWQEKKREEAAALPTTGALAELSAQEAEVVRTLLATAPGRVCSRLRLYEACCMNRPEADCTMDIKIVDVIICKVRKKLRPYGIEVKTHWGKGYSISEADRIKFAVIP